MLHHPSAGSVKGYNFWQPNHFHVFRLSIITYVSIHRYVEGICACAYFYVHTKSKLLTFKLFESFCPRTTSVILTQLVELVVLCLPWAGQSAGPWYSSPERCGDGHSAWLPPVPYESPPAAAFHLRLLVPVIPLSPGNAEKNIHHNRNTKTSAETSGTWTSLSANHQNLSSSQSNLAARKSALNAPFTDFSGNSWCPEFLNTWSYFINLIKYSWHIQHNHQRILHLPQNSGSALENRA